MSVLFANASNVQPLVNAEVVVATIAGPLDNLDAYVSGGAWADGTIVFYIYATVGAVRAKVAVGIFGGPTAARITWKDPSGDPIEGSVHAGGTSYDLVVFAQPNQSYQPAVPAKINATFAGVDQGDVVADANASGTAAAGATIATAAGFNQFADVSARMAGLPGAIFQLLASCGAGSVEAVVASAPTGGPDSTAVILKGIALPVATTYRIVAVPAQPGTTFNVTASLSTYFQSAGGGGGSGTFAGVIFRPGAASASPFVQTWAEVQAAIAASAGCCIVYVDNALAACHVPAASGVTDCLSRVELQPFRSSGAAPVTLTVDEGATLKSIASIRGALNLVLAPTATASLSFDFAGGNQPELFLYGGAQITMSGGATRAGCDLPVGGTLFVNAQGQTAIVGGAGGPVFAVTDATSSLIVTAQATLLGGTATSGAAFASGPGSVLLKYVSDTIATSVGLPLLPGTGSYTTVQIDSHVIEMIFNANTNNVLGALQASGVLPTVGNLRMDVEGFGGSGGGGGGQGGAGAPGAGGGGSGGLRYQYSSIVVDLANPLNVRIGGGGASGTAGVAAGGAGGDGADGGPTNVQDGFTGVIFVSYAGSSGGQGATGGVGGLGGADIGPSQHLPNSIGFNAAGGAGAVAATNGGSGNKNYIGQNDGASGWAPGAGGASAGGQGGGGGGGGAGPQGNGSPGGPSTAGNGASGVGATANAGSGAGGGAGGTTNINSGGIGGPGGAGRLKIGFAAP